jgi:hypothetical protein
MNTKIKKKFKMWRFVKCVSNSKIWADRDDFSTILRKGKTYFVIDTTACYGDLKNGPQAIRLNGVKYWHKSSNFVKVNFFKALFNIIMDKNG